MSFDDELPIGTDIQKQHDWRDPHDWRVWLLALLTLAIFVLPFMFMHDKSLLTAIATFAVILAGGTLSQHLKEEARNKAKAQPAEAISPDDDPADLFERYEQLIAEQQRKDGKK